MDQDQSKEPRECSCHTGTVLGCRIHNPAFQKDTHTPPIPRAPEDRTPSKIVPTCDCFVEKGMTFDRDLGIHRCSKCGAYEDYSDRTAHQQRIDEFMQLAGQEIKDVPFIPSQEVRKFRARIILEECLETVEALGFVPVLDILNAPTISIGKVILAISAAGPNLVEIADGCGDISVVTIGTLTACGISDKPVLEAVDENNLSKFKPRCPNCKEVMHQRMGGQSPRPVFELEHIGWTCWSCESQFPKEVGGYRREDGKWVKGTTHCKVDIKQVLLKQGAEL